MEIQKSIENKNTNNPLHILVLLYAILQFGHNKYVTLYSFFFFLQLTRAFSFIARIVSDRIVIYSITHKHLLDHVVIPNFLLV